MTDATSPKKLTESMTFWTIMPLLWQPINDFFAAVSTQDWATAGTALGLVAAGVANVYARIRAEKKIKGVI